MLVYLLLPFMYFRLIWIIDNLILNSHASCVGLVTTTATDNCLVNYLWVSWIDTTSDSNSISIDGTPHTLIVYVTANVQVWCAWFGILINIWKVVEDFNASLLLDEGRQSAESLLELRDLFTCHFEIVV